MCSVSGAHAWSVVGVSSNCFHRIDDIFNAVKMRHRLWGRLCRRSDVNSAAGYRCPRNFLSVILETFYSLVTRTFSSWRSRWKYEGKQSVIRFFKREVEQRGSNQLRCEKCFTPLWSKIQMFTVNASHCAADLSGFLNILCCSLKRNRRNSKVVVIAIAPMFLWSTRSRPPTLTNPFRCSFGDTFLRASFIVFKTISAIVFLAAVVVVLLRYVMHHYVKLVLQQTRELQLLGAVRTCCLATRFHCWRVGGPLAGSVEMSSKLSFQIDRLKFSHRSGDVAVLFGRFCFKFFLFLLLLLDLVFQTPGTVKSHHDIPDRKSFKYFHNVLWPCLTMHIFTKYL